MAYFAAKLINDYENDNDNHLPDGYTSRSLVNACANERNASKLAISQREQPSVYDEVINVIVNVNVKKAVFLLCK